MDGFRLVGSVDESNIVEESVLLLQGQKVGFRADAIRRHRRRQDDIQIADGRLLRLAAPGLDLPHEGDAPDGVGVAVLDAHAERQPVLPEGPERQRQLLSRLGHRHDVPREFQILRLGLQHLPFIQSNAIILYLLPNQFKLSSSSGGRS